MNRIKNPIKDEIVCEICKKKFIYLEDKHNAKNHVRWASFVLNHVMNCVDQLEEVR